MRRGNLTAALGLSAAVVLAAAVGCGSSRAGAGALGRAGSTAPAPTAAVKYAYVTYTGWFDNSPPGCVAQYVGCAGGFGTYTDPITFASSPGEFRPGTRVYYPPVQKYFVMGDQCVACERDWSGKGPNGGPHLYHIDLWIGGKDGNEFDAINCEDGLTQNAPSGAPMLTPVLVNPPRGLPVSTEPLFNTKTGACFGGVTSGGTRGRYRNAATGDCLEDPGNSMLLGTAARADHCNGGSSQAIWFEGAFFTVNNLCLTIAHLPPRVGAKLIFSGCAGGPAQQWEINTNGTLSGPQSHLCVAESRKSLILATCTAAANQRWAFSAVKPY